MNDYKRLAKDYDFLNPKEEIFKQKPFFLRLIKNYSVRTCLDCARGTGWHLLMLSDLGLECFGSDLSPEMLALARKNLSGKKIPLKKQDFRTLSDSWKEKFDMIICMTTSFPHLLTDQEAVTALQSMHERLNEGGIVVIDSGIPDALLNARPKCIPGRILKDRAFYFFLEYPNRKRIVVNILYVKKTENSFAHAFFCVHYRAMRKSALEKYFARTKFNAVHYFGDHRFRRYSEKKSRRLIAIAQR